jgi:ferrochelatase
MKTSKIGIVLINLGSPSYSTPSSIRKFLQQFLHDHRVIEISRWIWCPILHGIILPFRPKSLVHKYESIWTEQGSPLTIITKQQTESLQKLLETHYNKDSFQLEYAMTYGEPSIHNILSKLAAASISRLIILPLYPQNSGTTVGACFDQVTQFLKLQRSIPNLHFISGYADFPPYIEALKNSVEQYWKAKGRGEKLLISFHGLPERNIKLGDPYLADCQKTASLLATALNLKSENWEMVFQSRFGKATWLKPYLEPRLIELAQEGVKKIDIICPGFAADCLETLEEICQSYKTTFIQAGGDSLSYIPALNTETDHIKMMAELVSKEDYFNT